MPAVRRAGLALVMTLAASHDDAHAQAKCHVVDLDFLPAEITNTAPMRAPSQIVAWVEDPAGQYVDTIFITQQTGSFGLGNRPGRFDFNSGPRWPYGRRVNVFPVWAHRRAASGAPIWQEIVFQNGEDWNLSHPYSQSSKEMHFCRPLMDEEPGWDTATCASTVFTDKGMFHATRTSLYPPRTDLVRLTPDAPSVEMFAMLNPFDAVSAPTPPSGVPAVVTWPIPDDLPRGDYVMWIEVSREFDHNATYSVSAYPAPTGIPWDQYGEPYRGQPSVVYKVPFTIGAQISVSSTLDYAGYGDPEGDNGTLSPPDGTISTTVPGSGAGRLAIRADGGTMYRARVITRPENDDEKPGPPAHVEVNTLTTTTAVVEFTAPGDDGLVGKVKGYEVRMVSGRELSDANFTDGIELRPDLAIVEPGTLQEIPLVGLLHDTEYTVGIRAFDDCRNVGYASFVTFRTPDRANGEVDACFVATAAYGSAMANDVEMLRRFRDMFLSQTVLGELAVEAYYTFGPAIAGVVGESELLRATARATLAPITSAVKVLRF